MPQLAAAHKPGAIPLRPLRLGDMYDAAFKIIRRNPGATVGSATLVTALTLAIPILVVAVMTQLLDLGLPSGTFDVEGSTGSLSSDDPATTGEVAGLLVALGSFALSMVLQAVGIVLVTGMIAHVTMAAAVGRRLSLGEAWAATGGKRWRLLGLASLLVAAVLAILALYALSWVPVALTEETWVIVGYLLVSLPVLFVALVWFWVRLQYYAVPALMLEPVGVLGAVRRSLALSRRQFWRTLGIAVLTAMVTGVAGSMLSTPVSLVGQLLTFLADSPEAALLITLVVFAASSTIQYAFTTPFTSTVSALQYLDQRMRKEAYDVELVARTGGLLP
ncbi:hypothetical protein GCM10027026_43810 [Myroides odoratimimus subsp. xuanwuensis]